MHQAQVFEPPYDREGAPQRGEPLTQALFDFAQEQPPDEQQLYKQLIEQTRRRRNLCYSDLGRRLGCSKSQMHRLLTSNKHLSDQARDILFNELSIDPVRAKLCVVFFQSVEDYDDFAAFAISEAFKAWRNQIETYRHGLHIEIKPSIIHELMKRAFTTLLEHQERVLERRDNLEA